MSDNLLIENRRKFIGLNHFFSQSFVLAPFFLTNHFAILFSLVCLNKKKIRSFQKCSFFLLNECSLDHNTKKAHQKINVLLMNQIVLISELYKDGYVNFIQLIALKMNGDKDIIPVHKKIQIKPID